MTTLSIVIPAYNEDRFIGTLLEQIQAVDLSPLGVSKEVIVVDDCSKDRTSAIVAGVPGRAIAPTAGQWGQGQGRPSGNCDGDRRPAHHSGRRPRVRAQRLRPDAPRIAGWQGNVVYGSRYLGRGRHPNQSWTAYLGGRSLSVAAWLATGRFLTDTVTAYELFRRSDLAALDLQTSGFELDHEITARMLARGLTIVEVPISYAPRSREEGKKIGARDWFVGVAHLLSFPKRLSPPSPLGTQCPRRGHPYSH